MVQKLFYSNIKEGNITLKKAEEEQKEFETEINDIRKGKKKADGQILTINNIKKLCESQEKAIKLFDEYSKIVSKAKYKTKYGDGFKILTPKQMI